MLAGGFLGRLCLSGDFATLRPEQRALVADAIALYRRVAPIIRRGRSHRHGPDVQAYRHAEGWQAVVRIGATGRQALVVAHTFAKSGRGPIPIPLPAGRWRIAETLREPAAGVTLTKTKLRWHPRADWAATVVLLTR